MQTLPVTPVDALAATRFNSAVRAPIKPRPVPPNGNTGIVPPYMTTPRNGGIVPPYLRDAIRDAAAPRNGGFVPPYLRDSLVRGTVRNPGIVPPWLQGRPVGPTRPTAVAGVAALAR